VETVHRRRRIVSLLAVGLAFAAGMLLGARDDAPSRPAPAERAPGLALDRGTNAAQRVPRIHWRTSRSLGSPNGGRLVRAVHLPVEGADFVTWHPVRDEIPNAPWRRWGSHRLVRTLLRVLRAHRRAFPEAPRVLVGDLSRRSGGPFPPSEEGGHASHQNGLDADVYLPRGDGLPRPPLHIGQVDRARAQDLVDRFVAAGAQKIFVSRRLRLRGPSDVVMHWPRHGDHLHVRLARDR
jgi:murein endopeptidase